MSSSDSAVWWTRQKSSPNCRPASPSAFFVSGDAANSTVPAGNVRPSDRVNGARASFAVRPPSSRLSSARTAVAEFSLSA